MGNILLPKQYHPAFKYKRAQPQGEVKLTNKYCPIPSHYWQLARPGVFGRNIIGNGDMLRGASAYNKITQHPKIGYCVEITNTTSHAMGSINIGSLDDGANTKPFCLMLNFLPYSTGSLEAICSIATTPGSGGPFLLVNATGLNYQLYINIGYQHSFQIKTNESHCLVFNWDGSQFTVGLDGLIVTQLSYSSLARHEQNLNLYIGNGYAASKKGLYGDCALWYDNSLSVSQAVKVSRDPYSALLEPANDQYYFVPDGGGVGGDNYSGTATSTNTTASTASGQKASTGTATSTADDTTTTTSFKTGLGNVTSINTASTVKTGLAIMLGTAISLNVAATTTAGTKSETATGTATSSNSATATTTGDKAGLGTATSNNTSTTTTDGVQSGTGAGSATSTNTASTATAGSKSGLGLVSSVNGYLITLQSNAIMLGTATSSNTSESTVIGLSENDASGTLTSTSTSQTITAGTKIGLGDIESANTSATTTTATTDREGTLTSANTSSAIVSGANTAAPVIIRSVDLVCELPYILLTRAIDGSLFMAYPPEVSNITTAYQNNDTNINVVITDNGEAVSMGSITEAEYVIASRDKSQTYVSKSLGSGISKGSDQLVLSLSQADTSALLDIYYHELQITSDGKHATVFAEHINFIDTVI